MSEKRFEFYSDEDLIGVLDTVTGRTFNSFEIVDLLNEQQATISQLEEENKKLIEDWEFSFRTELAHHRFAEKELQEKIREKQATIQSLKEENKKLKNIHWY